MAKNGSAALHAVDDEQTEQPQPEKRRVVLSAAKNRLIEQLYADLAALNSQATGILKAEAAEAGFESYHGHRDERGIWTVVEGPQGA